LNRVKICDAEKLHLCSFVLARKTERYLSYEVGEDRESG